jgi:hypothetical protein
VRFFGADGIAGEERRMAGMGRQGAMLAIMGTIAAPVAAWIGYTASR